MPNSLQNKMSAPELIREVKITRSQRRKKTISAYMIRGALHVHAPCHISESSLNEAILNLKERFAKRLLREGLNSECDLAAVAEELNKKYFSGKLSVKSIQYVTNQESKFGCCNYNASTIRISHLVASMPLWVRDYVIIHELAHLIEPNHGEAFWRLVNKYRLAERARGYLIAKGMEMAQPFLLDEMQGIK